MRLTRVGVVGRMGGEGGVTMVSSKAMMELARNPVAYMKFMTQGEVPRGECPKGPLVELLKKIQARDLCAMRGVTVGAALGYSGKRTFGSGMQALRWVAPSDEVFGGFPADSWRDKRFNKRLTVDDLAEACAYVPSGFLERYPGLRRS